MSQTTHENDSIYLNWPPSLQTYEQTFFGISWLSFLLGGVAGLAAFVVCSSRLPTVSGLVWGGCAGAVTAALTILFTTRFARFHYLLLPAYILARVVHWRTADRIELPLIASSTSTHQIVVEDFDGQLSGIFE